MFASNSTHTPIQSEILIYNKVICRGEAASLPHMHVAFWCGLSTYPWKCKENYPKEAHSEFVLPRTCSSHNPNHLPTWDVQVQPIENKGSVVSISHLIVSECYLPMGGPVVRTSPLFEEVSAFRDTGLKSRIIIDRLMAICFSIHLIHSFIHSHNSRY